MSEEKKDLFRDIKYIQEEMDLLFDHFSKIRHSPLLTAHRLWRPHVDVYETKELIVIVAELAGVHQKDVSITVNENVLTIRGERPQKKYQQHVGVHNCEILYGKFERNIRLPEPTDPDEIQASLKDGVLEVKIAKRPGKSSRTQEIQIDIET